MKSPVAPAVAAAALLAAAVLLWIAGTRELGLARAERSLATLKYGRAAGEHERVRPSAEYWLGRYDAVSGAADRLLAANAGYRAAVRHGGDWRSVVGRLDGVVAQYADLLRSEPGHPEAAYNYEFAVRYRAAVAARQQPVAPEPVDFGTTVHGREGSPPSGADAKRFKVIVPMRPDERREAEEAGRGGRRIRKG